MCYPCGQFEGLKSETRNPKPIGNSKPKASKRSLVAAGFAPGFVTRVCFRNWILNLLRSSPCQHHRHGPPQDLKVQPQGPVVDVLEVKADPVFKVRDVVPAADLPQTGQTR